MEQWLKSKVCGSRSGISDSNLPFILSTWLLQCRIHGHWICEYGVLPYMQMLMVWERTSSTLGVTFREDSIEIEAKIRIQGSLLFSPRSRVLTAASSSSFYYVRLTAYWRHKQEHKRIVVEFHLNLVLFKTEFFKSDGEISKLSI